MVHTPDGMGVDRYHERQNMKEAANWDYSRYTHELVALDAGGEEVYRTEAFTSEEEAQAAADALNGDIPDDIDDSVERFEPAERED